MQPKTTRPDPQRQAQLLAELRRDTETRQAGYRARALKLFPHVCARCGREFDGKRLKELTVHHKDVNHDNNPTNGSNWELLCIYCHDHEHATESERALGGEGPALIGGRDTPALANPFAGLDRLIKPEREQPALIKCIFFDRDGIVNQHPGPGYVERWEDFHLLPEFVDVLRLVRQKGYVAVIISNQRGVALGKMTAETVEDLHCRLRAVLKEQHGLALLDIFYCPHDRNECECRKPKPGMLLEAARRHGIDLSQSWMIGDSIKDVEAGKAAGCRTVLVNATESSDQADVQVADMPALRSSIAKIIGDH